MQLYSYWRSSSSYRVRIALNLKGIDYQIQPVHLVKDGGQQHSADYRAINPAGLVPALVLDDGRTLTQSLAILEWLETAHPTPPLLPTDPVQAAQVRAAAMTIAMEVQPITNVGTLNHLRDRFGADKDVLGSWMSDWMQKGFHTLQSLLPPTGPYCFGDTPTLADVCLIPQLYNAHRWGVDLTPFPRLTDIEAHALATPAFHNAAPAQQPDADT